MDPRRKAVAATLTSVLVFSAILVANQVVYTSENQWLHAVSVADMERAEAVNSRIFAAGVVFDSLSGVQALLQRVPLACVGQSDPGRNLSMNRTLSKSTRGVSYTVNVSLRPVGAGPTSDNLTMLAPFAGYQNGSFNLVARVSMLATAGQGLPYYSKSETHFLHLPVPIELSRQLCLSVIGGLSGLSSSSCSDAALGLLSSRYARVAATDGLDLSVVRVSGSGHGCAGAAYQVTVLQESAEGVAGPFSWKMVGQGAPSPG